MAILIPSKNIYNKNNPKVRDNVIDNVTVNQTIISLNNQYDIPVHYETLLNFSVTNTTEISENFEYVNKNTRPGSTENVVVKFVSYVAFDNYGKTNVSIKFPIATNNSYIQRLFYGINDQNDPNIKFTLHGYKKSGTVRATLDYSYANDTLSMSNIIPTETESVLQTYQIPKQETFVYEGYNSTLDVSATVSSTVNFANLGTILTAIPTIKDDKYEISFDFISKYRVVKIGSQNAMVGGTRFAANGTYEEYIPEQIDIALYGNTIGIDLKDGSVNIYSGNKPFSLNSNELLQDSGTVGGKSIAQHLGLNVYNQYKKGKETAKILCNISDYYLYGEKETKAKSIKSNTDMVFHQNDQVIPMVLGADGKDYPMSVYQNGEPKIFTVIGTDIIFDGAVWQELTLQEYNS